MKFKTNHSRYFKEWSLGKVRILKDVYAKTFYPYQVQRYEIDRWVNIRAFRTLADAKEAAEWVLDDMIAFI